MLKLGHISKDQIQGKFIEDLHESIFNEKLPSDYFRYDSCLIAQDDNDNIVSYVLIREITSEMIELAWGGTSKDFRGVSSKIAMQLFTDECLKYYPAVMFQTWNKNIPMIRLGLLNGYIITGTRTSLINEMFLIFTKKRGE